MPDRKLLPPDRHHVEMALSINSRIPNGAKVGFYRIQTPDEPDSYGAVFEYYSARHTVERSVQFFDDDGLVKEVESWIDVLEAGSPRYTLSPPGDYL